MLRRTFCHIPGIGLETERRLWGEGCHDWDCLLAEPEKFSYGSAARDHVVASILAAREALESGNHQYFRKNLAAAEAWRAWPDFRHSCVYLDIETDGGRTGDAVTMVGLYDGREFRCLIAGEELGSFLDVISQYSMVVTFFGTVFDLPMLEKRFRGFRFDQIHLDLCFALKRLGYRGGLKKIEKQLGISRVDEVDELNGLDAIRLWRNHCRGCPTSLSQLVAYNREDVINLERLAEFTVTELTKSVMPQPVGSLQ